MVNRVKRWVRGHEGCIELKDGIGDIKGELNG